jgi:hypothetical protein
MHGLVHSLFGKSGLAFDGASMAVVGNYDKARQSKSWGPDPRLAANSLWLERKKFFFNQAAFAFRFTSNIGIQA